MDFCDVYNFCKPTVENFVFLLSISSRNIHMHTYIIYSYSVHQVKTAYIFIFSYIHEINMHTHILPFNSIFASLVQIPLLRVLPWPHYFKMKPSIPILIFFFLYFLIKRMRRKRRRRKKKKRRKKIKKLIMPDSLFSGYLKYIPESVVACSLLRYFVQIH